MDTQTQNFLLHATGANSACKTETIQSLWSDYGSIDRYELRGSEHQSAIIKHVCPPEKKHHPRGWNTDRSHQRKLRSYRVESYWYQHWAKQCGDDCRIPACFALEQQGNEVLIALEDLDSNGFALRKSRASMADMHSCLHWLAYFHATFMGQKPEGLWKIGSYWHLRTRPDELKTMAEGELKQAAGTLDKMLNEARYLTFVHGDAKLANFCFSYQGKKVAAVDFQYVGGGCGMKDVAYFISSCLNENECERLEDELLNRYFKSLTQALKQYHPQIDSAAVEADWRALYPVAWTDFYRFLKGWSPGHWKIHAYSERLARDVISQLSAG
ncbi:MAG: phosphotransferase [Gammaproteobacteria bacterium]